MQQTATHRSFSTACFSSPPKSVWVPNTQFLYCTVYNNDMHKLEKAYLPPSPSLPPLLLLLLLLLRLLTWVTLLHAQATSSK